MIVRKAAAAVAPLALSAGGAAAEVTARDGGVASTNTVEIAAPPERVWAALGRPAAWWNPSPTWSGSADNLSMEVRAGGCFCERLANGGSVLHGTVLLVRPNETLRLLAALGPMQEVGATGALTWTLTPSGGGTRVVFSYTVAGVPNGAQLAPVVDRVLVEQLQRLERYVETGRAGA